MNHLRIGDRVTVTKPQPHNAGFAGLRGTVTYFPGAGVLVSLDEGDEELFSLRELAGPHTDAVLGETAERVLARLL